MFDSEVYKNLRTSSYYRLIEGSEPSTYNEYVQLDVDEELIEFTNLIYRKVFILEELELNSLNISEIESEILNIKKRREEIYGIFSSALSDCNTNKYKIKNQVKSLFLSNLDNYLNSLNEYINRLENQVKSLENFQELFIKKSSINIDNS